LGSCFANYWGLKIPEFGFVNINPDHAGKHSELQPMFFHTPCFGSLYNREYKELVNQKYLESMRKEYYLCILNCKKKLNGILQEIPDEWLINKPVIKQSLLDNLFQEKWIDACFKEFLCFIQLTNQ